MSAPELLRETVAGGRDATLAGLRQALPQFQDDLQRLRGHDIYLKMRADGGVESPFTTLVLSILADGHRVEPAVRAKPGQGETDAKAKRAMELADFVSRNLEGWDDSDNDFENLKLELCDGLAFGHKVAEKVYRVENNQLRISRIATKDSLHVSFIVDEYMKTIGMVATTEANQQQNPGGYVFQGDPRTLAGFCPREKFIAHRWRSINGDPRGASVLMYAYNAWWLKKAVLPEFFRYLKQFATPLIIGTTGPNSGDEVLYNSDGSPMLGTDGQPRTIRKEQAMLNAILQIVNASGMVIPYGAAIQWFESKGNGEAFIEANNFCDRQIDKTILGTAQVTNEAQHESRSSKDGAMDVFQIRTQFHRGMLAGTLNRDIVQQLIKLNFEPRDWELMPRITLQAPAIQDKAALIDSYSKGLASGLIHHTQLAAIYEELGLPQPDMEVIAAEREDEAMRKTLAAGNIGKARNPAATDEEQVEEEE
jgi:hypothetical protein